MRNYNANLRKLLSAINGNKSIFTDYFNPFLFKRVSNELDDYAIVVGDTFDYTLFNYYYKNIYDQSDIYTIPEDMMIININPNWHVVRGCKIYTTPSIETDTTILFWKYLNKIIFITKEAYLLKYDNSHDNSSIQDLELQLNNFTTLNDEYLIKFLLLIIVLGDCMIGEKAYIKHKHYIDNLKHYLGLRIIYNKNG